jgi:hypothetical protein
MKNLKKMSAIKQVFSEKYFSQQMILSEKLFYLCEATLQWSAKVLLKLSSTIRSSHYL